MSVRYLRLGTSQCSLKGLSAWANSTKFKLFERVIEPNFPVFAENRLIYQEKASFLHIVTKSVEPIFQGLEPIVRHRALKGTLVPALILWSPNGDCFIWIQDILITGIQDILITSKTMKKWLSMDGCNLSKFKRYQRVLKGTSVINIKACRLCSFIVASMNAIDLSLYGSQGSLSIKSSKLILYLSWNDIKFMVSFKMIQLSVSKIKNCYLYKIDMTMYSFFLIFNWVKP